MHFVLFSPRTIVQSHEKDNEGNPLLLLSPPIVYVRSFNQLYKLVNLADVKKLEEVRACSEGKHNNHKMTFELNFYLKLRFLCNPLAQFMCSLLLFITGTVILYGYVKI